MHKEPRDPTPEKMYDALAVLISDWFSPGYVVSTTGVYRCLSCWRRTRLKKDQAAPAGDGHTSRWSFWHP